MSETRVIPPLRLAVLGDFEGMHTRRWLEVFVARGHELHAISYYRPRVELPGVTLHVLQPGVRPDGGGFWTERPLPRKSGFSLPSFSLPSSSKRIPPSLLRLVHAWRYRRAGLKRVLDEIAPDVFHAHYAVEHGFYGCFAGFHPYIVSAWGSDLLVESQTLLGRAIARRALRSADLVTGNDASLVQRAIELGVPPERAEVVHLGIEPLFLEAGLRSLNLRGGNPRGGDEPLTVVSDRALEPLYNVDVILRAFAKLPATLPEARLIVAGAGKQELELKRLAVALGLGLSVQFRGQQTTPELARLLASAHVYVSVPASDSLALSTVEAIAAGCFPIVADLPSVDGWVEDGVNGLRVRPGSVDALTAALKIALSDAELRRDAIARNRAKVESEGPRERNMLLMERHYYRLAGHPMAGAGESI